MSDQSEEIRDEGYRAYYAETPAEDNPYTPDTENYLDWQTGWLEAQREAGLSIPDEKGTSRTRTPNVPPQA